MHRIEQGRYYEIQFIVGGERRVIEHFGELKIGCKYRVKDRGYCKVLKEKRFKYTLQDVDNIRVMMEGYDEGTIQDGIRKRMVQAYECGIPNIRFSSKEKELLWYIYNENCHISIEDRETLRKVLEK